MADVSIYKRYSPSVFPPSDNAAVEWLFIFNSAKILINTHLGNPSIPTGADFNGIEFSYTFKQYLGELEGCPSYSMEVDDTFTPPEGMLFKDLRSLLGEIEEDLFLLAGRAFQIVNWNRMHKFCGKCGTPTEALQDELAKNVPVAVPFFIPAFHPLSSLPLCGAMKFCWRIIKISVRIGIV